ncbi:unnamed protein product [Lampetra fluviatilis]
MPTQQPRKLVHPAPQPVHGPACKRRGGDVESSLEWRPLRPAAGGTSENSQGLRLSPTGFPSSWSQWLPTWKREVNNGEEAALQVKDIRVWAYK